MVHAVKKMSQESVETYESSIFNATTTMNNNTCSIDESKFPDGLRVLLVDDSVVCLRVITALLIKCHYQVTSKENSAEALTLLQQNSDSFDIVLTNVHMDEFDGFKLLEAGLMLDIPVIMTSASDSKDVIMKGIRHGARDFLLKPLRMEEIKNIWQHVYRKKLPHLVTEKEKPSDNKKAGVKRREMEKVAEGSDDAEERENSRGRVRWSKPLHNRFVEAVEKLGGPDKAVPKKILETMGEKDISREKVASHLQKYRKVIKTKIDLDSTGTRMNNKNNNNDISSNNNNNNNNSVFVGPRMRGTLPRPGTNYLGGMSNTWLANGGYTSNPQPLQVLPSHRQQFMQQQQQQQPSMRMHGLNGNSINSNLNFVGGGAGGYNGNSMLNHIDHHVHQNLQQPPVQHHNGLIDHSSPSVIDLPYEQFALNQNFFDPAYPSLFSDDF